MATAHRPPWSNSARSSVTATRFRAVRPRKAAIGGSGPRFDTARSWRRPGALSPDHRVGYRLPVPDMSGGSADVAQLVEHHLAKVRVAGSNPVVRSERSCRRPHSVEWPRGEATACKAVYTGSNPVSTSKHRLRGAISSVGERFLDTEEVTGSIPVSPTISHLSPANRVMSRVARSPLGWLGAGSVPDSQLGGGVGGQAPDRGRDLPTWLPTSSLIDPMRSDPQSHATAASGLPWVGARRCGGHPSSPVGILGPPGQVPATPPRRPT